MFYVIGDAAAFGLHLTPDEGRDIVRISEMIKAAAQEQLPVVHPEQPGFAGVTIAELSGPATALRLICTAGSHLKHLRNSRLEVGGS
jgi:proline racemase